MGKLLNKIKDAFYIAKEKIKNGFIKVKNVLTKFFQKALSFLKIVIDKIKTRVRGVILGSAHFFRKIGNKYQEGTKNYSLEEEVGEWNETIVTKDIQRSDVPEQYYQTMDDEFEFDDTRELDMAIGC